MPSYWQWDLEYGKTHNTEVFDKKKHNIYLQWRWSNTLHTDNEIGNMDRHAISKFLHKHKFTCN